MKIETVMNYQEWEKRHGKRLRRKTARKIKNLLLKASAYFAGGALFLSLWLRYFHINGIASDITFIITTSWLVLFTAVNGKRLEERMNKHELVQALFKLAYPYEDDSRNAKLKKINDEMRAEMENDLKENSTLFEVLEIIARREM